VDDEFTGLPEFDPGDWTSVDAMLDFLRQKVAMPVEEFAALKEAAQRRAFTVAGVADLDIVSDVWEAIERAVRDGETLEDFRVHVGEKLASAWGGENPARLETIFRTNVHGAYSAGRQYLNQQVRDTHPYERYSVVDDDRTSDICEELIDVVVLSGTGPVPPLHMQCRTDKIACTEAEAKELSAELADGDDFEAAEGFGGDPMENYEPDLSTRPPEMASIFELKRDGGLL
jgi:hypothetical protein